MEVRKEKKQVLWAMSALRERAQGKIVLDRLLQSLSAQMAAIRNSVFVACGLLAFAKLDTTFTCPCVTRIGTNSFSPFLSLSLSLSHPLFLSAGMEWKPTGRLVLVVMGWWGDVYIFGPMWNSIGCQLNASLSRDFHAHACSSCCTCFNRFSERHRCVPQGGY